MNRIILTYGVAMGAVVLVAVPYSTSPEPVETRSPLLVQEVKILFVGDMFFDRSIRQYQEIYGEDHVFSCIDELFSQADLVVGNLEGPITTNPSVSLGSVIGSPENYTFTFPTTTATLLYRHNVRAVNLGNNHIQNFGLEGLVSTHEYLAKAEVGYFGGIQGNEPVLQIKEQGIPISFVSYNEFGGALAEEVAETIAAQHVAGNIVIVFTHWGEEYTDTRETLRPIAQLFAQNGASAVIGSHQHVILPSERIGDTFVYYSLGNFIFDQYFNVSVRQGLAVLLRVSPEGVVSSQEYPVELTRDRRTCRIPG